MRPGRSTGVEDDPTGTAQAGRQVCSDELYLCEQELPLTPVHHSLCFTSASTVRRGRCVCAKYAIECNILRRTVAASRVERRERLRDVRVERSSA